MRFIDTHCHLDFTEFDTNRAQTIANAQQVGVEQFIVPAVSLAQAKKLGAFVKKYPQVHVAAGLHPYFMPQHHSQHIDELASLISENPQLWVAIGECGIDRAQPNLAQQIVLFEQHIELANQFDLPLIIHHRQSHDLIAASLKRVPLKTGGVVHAFSGSLEAAKGYLKWGLKLGVGGTITYPRSKKTQNTLSQLSVKNMLLETDSPSMPLYGEQGKINTPAHIVKVFQALCSLHPQHDQAELAEQLYSSSVDTFRI